MITSFLLKKRINLTPYSSNAQPWAFIILYSKTKLLETLNSFTTLKYPWCNFLKLKLPHMLVLVWFTIGSHGGEFYLTSWLHPSTFSYNSRWWGCFCSLLGSEQHYDLLFLVNLGEGSARNWPRVCLNL
jgi:hypothetical protein